jgi:hypothetical protein
VEIRWKPDRNLAESLRFLAKNLHMSEKSSKFARRMRAERKNKGIWQTYCHADCAKSVLVSFCDIHREMSENRKV